MKIKVPAAIYHSTIGLKLYQSKTILNDEFLYMHSFLEKPEKNVFEGN